MKVNSFLFLILFISISVNLSSQTCPSNLIFYKLTATQGANICVEFDSDPGFESIIHRGHLLTRVGTSNQFSNLGGNCNGNSLPNAAQSFIIGTTTCSYSTNGTFSSQTVPVDLVSFDYKIDLDKIKLIWATSSEVNNDYFSVERMTDKGLFEEIGKIIGQGTSSQLENYEFQDRNPINGLNYYRLKQFDFDGQFIYSNTLSVQMNRDFNINQKSNLIDIDYPGKASFILYDIAGKLIEQISFTDQLSFDVSALKGKGMFVGTLVSNGSRISQKLLVF